MVTTRPTHRSTARSRRRRTALVGGAAALALLPATAVTASADHLPDDEVVARDLSGALSIAATRGGDLLATRSFEGAVERIGRHGTRTEVLSRPGEEVAGLTATADGFVSTRSSGRGPGATALVERTDRRGRTTTVVDLGAHERATDPDGDARYGLLGLDAACAARVPDGVPVDEPGEVYSHPYATADLGAGRLAVADAGGNAVHVVDARGRVRASVALPPQLMAADDYRLADLGIPACAAGATYAVEPVPTDVEVGPGGDLYVSLLPGGPLDGFGGERGSVVRVDADPVLAGTGPAVVTTVVRYLDGPTGIAVGPDGSVFVSQETGYVKAFYRPTPDSSGTDLFWGGDGGDVELVGKDVWFSTGVLRPGTGEVRSVRVYR